MIKYMVDGTKWNRSGWIDCVEVERETESSVWINGSRNAKRSEWKNYFDTFAEAKSWLVNRTEGKLLSYSKAAKKEETNLAELMALEEQEADCV